MTVLKEQITNISQERDNSPIIIERLNLQTFRMSQLIVPSMYFSPSTLSLMHLVFLCAANSFGSYGSVVKKP